MNFQLAFFQVIFFNFLKNIIRTKGNDMRSKIKIIGSGLAALALLQSVLAQEQLPTFKAPLKKTESVREYTGAMSSIRSS